MRLSIVIPTFDRAAVLRQTLPTVLAQDLPPEVYEVVVVADGCGDGTLGLLESFRPRCGWRVLSQPNRGAAAARNAGARAARGELLLFLDDDLVCPPDLARRHAAAHGREPPALVMGPVLMPRLDRPSAAYETTRRWLAASYGALERDGPAWPEHARVAPNTSLARALFLGAGGFDESFGTAHEDTELGLRLAASGLRFRYLSAPVEQLFPPWSSRASRREAERSGAAEVALCRKHPAYRPHSLLARLRRAERRWPRIREWAVRTPLPAAGLLDAARAAGEWAGRIDGAVRALGLERNLTAARAARRSAGGWRAFEREFWRTLPVLLYHDVGEARGVDDGLTVAPGRFAAQMRWLARAGYRTILPADWEAWRIAAAPLPERPVLVTFDDAYASLAEHAFPALERLGFRAAVFVASDAVGATNRWDEARGQATRPILSAAQIREWQGRGISFEPHGRTHADLRTLGDAALDDEIAGSAVALARITGRPATAFAYPYGESDPRVVAAARRHLPLAFTTDPGLNDLATDPHLLRRAVIQPGDTLLEFASRVAWGRSPLTALRARLRLRARALSLLGAVRR